MSSNSLYQFKEPLRALRFDGNIASITELIPKDARVLTGTGCARIEILVSPMPYSGFANGLGYSPPSVDIQVGQWLVSHNGKLEVWRESAVLTLLKPVADKIDFTDLVTSLQRVADEMGDGMDDGGRLDDVIDQLKNMGGDP